MKHNHKHARLGHVALRTVDAIQRHPLLFTAAGLAMGVLLGAKPELRRSLGRTLGFLARL